MRREAVKTGGAGSRIPELDGLRGLAILMVILCHYVGQPDHARLGRWPDLFLKLFTVGWSGVDLFFVLSGFLIGGILLEARNTPNYFRAFYMRRVFRILPIYYAWTLLFGVAVIVLLTFFPGRWGVTSGDLLRIPVQMLFLQNIFIGMPPFTWGWFVVTWSLAIEEQFYLVAPPLIRFLKMRTFVAVLASTVVLAPILRFLLFRYWAPGTFLFAFLMPCRADTLSCGMLLAVAWREERVREMIRAQRVMLYRALMVLFAGVGGLLWWLVLPPNKVYVTIGYSWLALFYSALLLTVVSDPTGRLAGVMRARFLSRLGGISYCVYLLHDALNFFAHAALFRSEPQLYNVAQFAATAAALLATLAIASLSWRYFEKPLILRGHEYVYGESDTESVPTGIVMRPDPVQQ